MELRYLRYFVAVVEERSFRQAAAKLQVAQPTISQQIKVLEDELGVPLLIREGNKIVRLTPAGKNVFALAKDLLNQVEMASEAMKHYRLSQKKLSVGLVEPIMTGMLMPAFSHFRATHPDIKLDFHELSPPIAHVEALRTHRVDLSFVGMAWKDLKTEFEVVSIRNITLAAALPKTHPLARRKSIKLNEIVDSPFVGITASLHSQQLDEMCQICQKGGMIPSFCHRVTGLASALALIEAGKGVSLMPQEFCQLPYPNVVFVQLKPKLTLDSVVAYRKSDPKLQAITTLINTVKEYFSRNRPSPTLKGNQPK